MHERQNTMIHPFCKRSVYVTSKGTILVHSLYVGKVYFTQVYVVEHIKIVENAKVPDQGP